ncbi:MAG: hypothetical protein GEU82_11735 [Luteitalea sp.]|nr:hypothetical protein [Luteitalea sp.]
MPKQLLIVEPDANLAGRLALAAEPYAHVYRAADFATARVLLTERSYDWLFTNVRLGDYNGLHLVHLVTSSLAARRALVYDEHADAWLADEARRMGAFYERGDRVTRAIAKYLCEAPSSGDRRHLLVAATPGSRARRGAEDGNPAVRAVNLRGGGDIRVTYRVERRPAAVALECVSRPMRRRQAKP